MSNRLKIICSSGSTSALHPLGHNLRVVFELAHLGLGSTIILSLVEYPAVSLASLRYGGWDGAILILSSGALLCITVLTANDNDCTTVHEREQAICGGLSRCTPAVAFDI